MKNQTLCEGFAKNLRELRKKNRLTQGELGEAIGYTEKSVSKWERGIAMPPAEALVGIADALGASLDELFGYGAQPSYYLGIDGGATKTDFALADSSSNVIRRVTLGSSNIFDIGFEAASRTLTDGIRKVSEGIPLRKISVFAGLSGGSSGDGRLSDFLDGLGFSCAKCGSDADNIIAAGLGDRDGIALIMGTGSSMFLKKNGEKKRFGGFGYLFDHGGSGYDIGNEVIRAALMSENGIGEKTLLEQMLREEKNSRTVLENLPYYYSVGKSGVASYAPYAFDAHRQGDKVASNILERNAKRIAELLCIGRKKMDCNGENCKAVLVGGLTKERDIFLPMIFSSLAELDDIRRYDISVFGGDVVIGALIAAGMPTKKEEEKNA